MTTRLPAGAPWSVEISEAIAVTDALHRALQPASGHQRRQGVCEVIFTFRQARAEVTLMFKAARAREKDRQDAEMALPMLNDASRRWLLFAVAAMAPHHSWLSVL